jgi:hypothetical protein
LGFGGTPSGGEARFFAILGVAYSETMSAIMFALLKSGFSGEKGRASLPVVRRERCVRISSSIRKLKI